MTKKYKLELTENELEALSYLVYENPCSSSCVYEEMQGKDCNKCKFQINKERLIIKIENLRGD